MHFAKAFCTQPQNLPSLLKGLYQSSRAEFNTSKLALHLKASQCIQASMTSPLTLKVFEYILVQVSSVHSLVHFHYVV